MLLIFQATNIINKLFFISILLHYNNTFSAILLPHHYHGRLRKELFQASPFARRTQGRPWTCWRDYDSQLAEESLGIPLVFESGSESGISS